MVSVISDASRVVVSFGVVASFSFARHPACRESYCSSSMHAGFIYLSQNGANSKRNDRKT